MSNQKLKEELCKSIEKRKVYSYLKANIGVAGLADMELTRIYNKGI